MKDIFTSEELIHYIATSKKETPVKVYFDGKLSNLPKNAKVFGNVLITNLETWEQIYRENQANIHDYHLENDRRYSAIPLLDYTKINARIEPGAIIREHAIIKDQAVIMMGAVINIGAVVGENTMIDMGAILGGRATTGKNCHIGAGAVLAGVIEPANAKPVIVEDNVLIGANAVVLEGVRIGKGAVVAAGAVVIEDVPAGVVVAGTPARIIKNVADVDLEKISNVDALRSLK